MNTSCLTSTFSIVRSQRWDTDKAPTQICIANDHCAKGTTEPFNANSTWQWNQWAFATVFLAHDSIIGQPPYDTSRQ